MEKFEVNRIDGKYIEFINKDGVSLQIFLGGNLDLYFVLKKADLKNNFVISKANYNVYELFLKLYEDIIEANIGEDSSKDYFKQYKLGERIDYEEYKEKKKADKRKLKKQFNYGFLVQNGIINWHSDEYPYEVGPVFLIKKMEDAFVISFYRGNIALQDNPSKYEICVRISNSGSYYNPFNIIFMRLFRDLNNLDLEDEQIYIEEYLYDEQMKRELKK